MAVHIANQITQVGTPMYCSACFAQDPQTRHVDFDAACDRGYGTEDHTVAMDDLVLCETCLRTGARLLGMTDDEEDAKELVSLRRERDREHYRADELEKYAAALENAVDSRPNPIVAPRRRGRPPRDEES